MDVRALITQYLAQAQLMQLATSHDNKPWISNLYFASDINLNLYWISRASKRHSQEIAKNSKVSGSIVLPHNYGQKVRGIQLEGEARQLKDQEEEQGFAIYRQRFWIVEERGTAADQSDVQHCYQLRPKTYYLFDEVNFPDHPHQELKI